jgi:hypothetical protein
MYGETEWGGLGRCGIREAERTAPLLPHRQHNADLLFCFRTRGAGACAPKCFEPYLYPHTKRWWKKLDEFWRKWLGAVTP